MTAVTYTFGINAQGIYINNGSYNFSIDTNIGQFTDYKPYARFYYDIMKDGRATTQIQKFEEKMNTFGFPTPPEFEDRRNPATTILIYIKIY